MKEHVFTPGLEEKFKIIDPETRGLKSRIQQILADEVRAEEETVKAEMRFGKGPKAKGRSHRDRDNEGLEILEHRELACATR